MFESFRNLRSFTCLVLFLAVLLTVFTGEAGAETKRKAEKWNGKKANAARFQKSKVPSYLQDRWFYASIGLRSDEEADELIQLIQEASDVKLNGMLWACGMEWCGNWSEERKLRFQRIKTAAEKAGIEIIPIIWSVGYGTMLGKNQNLVESLPIENLRVVARNGKVELDTEAESVSFRNGGFEEFNGSKFPGFDFHDSPGKVTFQDTEVKHSGNASLRIENFGQNKHGHGRFLQTIQTVPHRTYKIRLWYKTEGIHQQGIFRMQVYAKNGSIATQIPKIPEGGNVDWTEAVLTFTTAEQTEINFYAGIWDGKEGKIWLDDLSIESCDMNAPVDRAGTPITVKDVETGTIYVKGKDFTPEKLSIGRFTKGVQCSPILIPEGSRIKEGAKLTLTYYVPALSLKGQTSTCMSEPQLYELFEESAAQIMEMLAPRKWFLSMDEIRAANSCEACRKRNLPLSEILGDCITRQYQIIQKVQPGAQVYIWSDMLDPNHNCHAEYMLCQGDFTGVWDCIPKELIISCWYHKKREESMKFFSEKGFRTQGAAYYDVDSLDSSKEWLETCSRTPGCTGIMYTTWRQKYELMRGFGEMLQDWCRTQKELKKKQTKNP